MKDFPIAHPFPDATIPLINPPLDSITSKLACTLMSPRIAADMISLYTRTVARKLEGRHRLAAVEALGNKGTSVPSWAPADECVLRLHVTQSLQCSTFPGRTSS